VRAPVLGYKEAMAVVPVCWVPGPAPRVALAPEAVVAQRAAAGFAVKGLDEVRVIFACMEKERSGREGTIMVRVGREAGGEQKERALREGGEEKITGRAIASNPPSPPHTPLTFADIHRLWIVKVLECGTVQRLPRCAVRPRVRPRLRIAGGAARLGLAVRKIDFPSFAPVPERLARVVVLAALKEA